MSAACISQLREAVDIIHSKHFHKLTQLKPECQTLLSAMLNCHINWLDHNHRQIMFVPGEPGPGPAPQDDDLRCSKCLKNQTFHLSEVKGNPKNIDVSFDFIRMSFVSSCCAAPTVPLCTDTVNTWTFTELKQMYNACTKCKQPMFSETGQNADDTTVVREDQSKEDWVTTTAGSGARVHGDYPMRGRGNSEAEEMFDSGGYQDSFNINFTLSCYWDISIL
ncbi:hypothetical protein GOODEAATRI_031740 [Goodea atripinnis]|uniref:Uncharacterized protein n=1 Tax=Goodea atripinnis TaxID=208336 RepID=A0ABV0PTJ9_9TELE